MITTIPQSAIDLILESEGNDQPWRHPGGGSGITLGYGCDIGADPASLEYWRGILADTDVATLMQAKGITGIRAKRIETRFRGINVSRIQALQVFATFTLPHEIGITLKGFPGLEFMPPGVIGAMVSLVYNRGTDIAADPNDPDHARRKEMRVIHEILAEFHTFAPDQRAACMKGYATKMAIQFRKMKRLWIGHGLDGLLTRRDAEADMVVAAVA